MGTGKRNLPVPLEEGKLEARKTVLVTGCSSGVGQASARLLARQGYDVLACVRREVDGQVVERLDPGRIHAMIVELQDQSTIDRAVTSAAEFCGENGLQGLVNCAGNLYCGPLEYFSRELWFKQYDVNLFGTMALTKAMLPLIRQGHGRIINIGAVGGGLALPFYGAIATSKIALEAANDCLRRELHPWGIHVSIIEPGGIDTPANDKMQKSVQEYLRELSLEGQKRYGDSMAAFSKWAYEMHKHNLKPEKVARTVLKALEAKVPKVRYRLGWDSRGSALLRWLLPDRIFDMLILKFAFLPVHFGAWDRPKVSHESKTLS